MTHPQPSGRPLPPRPPSALRAVSGAAAEAYLAPVDWSLWYLTDEADMGESPEQAQIIDLLKPAVRRLVEERGWTDAFVGSDAFFAWMEHEPNVRVSPDIYVMAARPPGPLPRMWKTWLEDTEPPLVAIEIVSETWRKDYEEAHHKYAALGVRELIVFDPGATAGPIRVPIQVYQWTDDDIFVSTHRGHGPAWSTLMRVWLVVVETADGPRLRLSRDEAGRDLVLTDVEADAAEREARLAEREARLAEREARLAAEREVARLRAALEQRDG